MAVEERQTGTPPPSSAGREGGRRSAPADRVARLLEREIRVGALAPGARLGTRESLRARFRVPVGAVGEAIRALQERGLVEVRPGPRGGIFVASAAPSQASSVAAPAAPSHAKVAAAPAAPHADAAAPAAPSSGGAPGGALDRRASIADCLAVRDALAATVAGAAARHATVADVAELRELMAELARHAGDRRACLRAGWRLHRRIAEIAPADLHGELLAVADRAAQAAEARDARVSEPDLVDPAAEIAFHRELVDAIAARDPDRVAAVVGRHRGRAAGR